MIPEIRELIGEILKSEEEFMDIYAEILTEIKNPEVRQTITRIMNDEKRHADNARKMLDILEKSGVNSSVVGQNAL